MIPADLSAEDAQGHALHLAYHFLNQLQAKNCNFLSDNMAVVQAINDQAFSVPNVNSNQPSHLYILENWSGYNC